MNSESLEDRLDEFAETHGAVLLGMHKDVTTLKSEVSGTLAKHSAEFQTKTDDLSAKQQSALNEMASKLAEFKAERRQTSNETAAKFALFIAETWQLLNQTESKIDTFSEQQKKLQADGYEVLDKANKSQSELSHRQKQYDANIVKQYAIIERELQKINKEAKRHQAEVDKFRKTTRNIALSALTLMIGAAVWLAVQAWK